MTTRLRRSAGYGEKKKGGAMERGPPKWTPHNLRHAAACRMLFDLKLDPAVVADKLCHAKPNSTVKRYIGVRGDADAAVLAATEGW